jgi:hypothetical protein
MTMSIRSENVAPVSALKCFADGCTAPVVFSFMWPWGEPAGCCSLHRTHAQQKSDALERGQLSFTVLDPHKQPAVTRDERTQLIAAKLSADEELRLVQAQNANLYNECEGLREDARRINARNNRVETELADVKAQRNQATKERDTALADVAELQGQLERTKRLIPKEPQGGGAPPQR